MTYREGLMNKEDKVESVLTHLAVDKETSPSTQNKAVNALVFLYKQIGCILNKCNWISGKGGDEDRKP